MGKAKKNSENSKKKEILLAIKKDEEEIRKYEKLLKIKKNKRSFISDLFSSMDQYSDDENRMDDDVNDELENENLEDEDVEDQDDDIEEDDFDDEEIESIEEQLEDKKVHVQSSKVKEITNILNKDQNNSTLYTKIKQNILQYLNKLCEAQMMKCLDGIEEIWNNFPRGDVRDVFIKESVAYMRFSCIDLAAFVVYLHVRLYKHTNLVAFYMEHLITKMVSCNKLSWEDENNFATVLSLCKFISYITRLETIDCNLIMDLMADIVNTFDLPHLKVLVEICSIIGFYLRKNCSNRCDGFVTLLKEKMSIYLMGSGDMNELRSYAEAIVSKLTLSKSKGDVVYQSIDKYKKLMRKCCRSTSLSETIALKLSDFQGDNRVRWWLVGSAVDPNVVHNKNVGNNLVTSSKIESFSSQELEWNTTAKSIGLHTEGKQALFRILMKAKFQENQDDISATVEQVIRLSMSSGGMIVLSESEVVRTIIRCLSLEVEFCQLYVNVLAALVESHRRFRQIVKCSIWDILAQPKLIESAKSHCGRCVGQLIAMAGLPINVLKKFNFMDNSEANTVYLMSVLTEILDENWTDISEFLKEALTTISLKFIGNLRLFLKNNFKVEDSERHNRSTVFKVNKCIELLQELRKSANMT